MTDIDKKRAEIWKGLKDKLREHGCEEGFGDLDLEDAVDLFLTYLHFQGVVIKVDRDLAEKMRHLDDEYFAVEPLVKEGD